MIFPGVRKYFAVLIPGLLVLGTVSASDPDYLVSYEDSVDLPEDELNVSESYGFMDLKAVEASEDVAGDVEDMEAVEEVEPNYRVEAMVSDSAVQIGADRARQLNYTGEGAEVAVLDSGVAHHENLDLENQVDFTGEGAGDENGHGTHVAGVIASDHGRHTGIAPEVALHDVKVLDETGRGRAHELLRGLDYSVRNDLDIAVLSLGSEMENCNGRDAVSRGVNTASRNGVLPVAASGNLGPERETVTAPGCAEDALTVGAVDRRDSIAGFSGRGPTSDGRTKPDVVAPGVNIASTGLNGFVRKSGTSMATPHVAGQASILISQNHSKEEARTMITNTTVDLGYEADVQGSGRIDIPASLEAEIEPTEARTGFWRRLRLYLESLFFNR